jgi:ABC-type glutathione transport system ATPase component
MSFVNAAKIDITKKLPESNHFNSKWVRDRYDLDIKSYEKNWKFEFSFPDEWKIGLIVGNSGSGKSLIARNIFEKVYQDQILSNVEVPLVEAMGSHDMQDIVGALTHVGMGSAPEWVTPYKYLSTGQRMRADLAFCLLNDEKIIVFDEFTSVVDRSVAKIVSHSIQKSFRKKNKQFVAVTCHKDVEEWLQPDWVLDMDDKEFRTVKKKDQTSFLKSILAKGKFGNFSHTITI